MLYSTSLLTRITCDQNNCKYVSQFLTLHNFNSNNDIYTSLYYISREGGQVPRSVPYPNRGAQAREAR